MNKIEMHQNLLDGIHQMYIEKNHDYGDSVHDTFEKYGLVSFLVRMEDKLNRAKTISKVGAVINTESLKDTLLDLANYAILAVMELSTPDKDTLLNNLKKDLDIAEKLSIDEKAIKHIIETIKTLES